MRRTRGLALVVVLAGAGLVVSACGGDSARSAAEEELDVNEVVVVDEADATDADLPDAEDSDADADSTDTETDSDSSDTETDTASDTDDAGNPTKPAEPENLFELATSGNLGTRVCVRNETGAPTGIAVSFTKSDSANSGTINAGGDEQQRCGEGTFFVGNDVEGKIYFSKDGAATYEFVATNPWAGLPSGGFSQDTGKRNGCVGGEFDAGSSGTYDDGFYSITMSRQSDGKWKEFLITIKPSTDPSADGKVKPCPATAKPAIIKL